MGGEQMEQLGYTTFFLMLLLFLAGYIIGNKHGKNKKKYTFIAKGIKPLKTPPSVVRKEITKNDAKKDKSNEYQIAIESIFAYDGDVALDAIKKEMR